MSQDFARTKHKAPRKSGGSSIPGWVWLLTGIITGAFVMFLIYLSGLAPTGTLSEASPKINVKPVENVKRSLEKPIFEFYDTLMNNEVITSLASNIQDTKNSADTPPPVYILQAASFKKLTEADSLKAQLILEGLDTSIAKFNNRGDIYHRVIVGPFSDTQKMTQAKKILATHNLSPIVLQKKSDT